MFLVRYSDSVRIFCRKRSDAIKTMIATSQWVEQRLRLHVHPQNARIVNLKKQYVDFLGLKIKVREKGNKYVVKSHMTKETQRFIGDRAVRLISGIARPRDGSLESKAIYAYNSFVMGEHNYYQAATNCSVDFKRIAFRVNKVLENRIGQRLKRSSSKPKDQFVMKKYGKSDQMRFISDHPVAPIGYISAVKPMQKKRSVNRYTVEGRASLFERLEINPSILTALMKQPAFARSAELFSNRISKYCDQRGRCAVTNREFRSVSDIHCHHILPVGMGGKDCIENLALILEPVHRLIHASRQETISNYLKILNPSPEAIRKINSLRGSIGNSEIPILC